MDGIREWAAALCAAAVLCAAFGMVTPEGKQGKCFRLVLSILVLCLIVSPLSELKGCTKSAENFFTQPASAESELMSLVESQTVSAISDSVSRLVADELEELGITAQEICVGMDITEDGCISIGQVVIVAAHKDSLAAGTIIDRIYNRLGLTAQVRTAEE